MELAIDTYRAWAQSQRKRQDQKPRLDIEKIIRAKRAQQAYERLKFQVIRRNLINPLFIIDL